MTKRTYEISPELQRCFLTFIEKTIGLHLPQERWKQIERKLHDLAKEFEFESVEECLLWLIKTRLTHAQISTVANHLAIKETYFFRDPNLFKVVEAYILPGIFKERAKSNQQIRIWSTACCTGEEPYSLAMILHRMTPDLKEWNISILGTDINLEALKAAREGLYRAWSLRATPALVKNRYFTEKENGIWELSSNIRKMVKFTYNNILEETPQMQVDIILCNNLLIYFSKKQIQMTIEKLTDVLVDGGWLIVSAVEVPLVKDPRLKRVLIDNITLFQKK